MLNRFRMLTVLLALTVTASCGSSPLSLLTGSGPNVAANTQVGRTNTQTIGTSRLTEQTLVSPQADTIKQVGGDTAVQADVVQKVVINEVPVWAILLILLAWLCPSHKEIGRYIRSLFGKA
jgi:hypothetical protein